MAALVFVFVWLTRECSDVELANDLLGVHLVEFLCQPNGRRFRVGWRARRRWLDLAPEVSLALRVVL